MSVSARMAHAAKMISTIILNVKFFPVMKGKKSELLTIRGIKGIIKIPTRHTYLAILFMLENITC